MAQIDKSSQHAHGKIQGIMNRDFIENRVASSAWHVTYVALIVFFGATLLLGLFF